MAEEDVPPRRQFQIVRNGEPTPANIDWSQGVETVQKGIADALNARNVAFLLGAGCSSLRIDGEERGISTMQPLAEIFCNTTTQALAAAQQAAEDEDLLGEDLPPVESPDWLLTREEVAILQEAGVELEDEYARNLERLMEGPAQSPFRLPTHQKGNCAEQAFYPSISLFKIIISLTNTAIFFAAEGARHSHFMRNSISKFLSSPEHVGGRCRAPGELYSFSNNIRFVAELSE
ncbi:MAG: hypothetical protein E5X60_25525 [Mesorhizobium sp.]|nr:MAG: hypothetical protein E5X60_25525 [Mesorhizobium sp.]